METLPEKLNITYSATYDVEEIVKQLREDNRDITGELEITLDDVVESIIVGFRDAVAEAKSRDFVVVDDGGDEV